MTDAVASDDDMMEDCEQQSDAGVNVAMTDGAGSGPSRNPSVHVGHVAMAMVIALVIRTCKLCLHKSDEDNPLRSGPHMRTSDSPGWPWLYGTAQRPCGNICRLCYYVWELGGFKAVHKNITIYTQAMTQVQTLADEHLSCLRVVIEKINKGDIASRLKGGNARASWIS